MMVFGILIVLGVELPQPLENANKLFTERKWTHYPFLIPAGEEKLVDTAFTHSLQSVRLSASFTACTRRVIVHNKTAEPALWNMGRLQQRLQITLFCKYDEFINNKKQRNYADIVYSLVVFA